MKKTFEFIDALKSNNDRDWFQAHKDEYQSAKIEFESLITKSIGEIIKFDPSIGLITAKESVFRIFRDVRFSANKLPYKTNMGAFVGNGGRKSTLSGYYIHIEPGASMVGGGIYMPQSDVLKKIRQEIYFNAGEFKKIIKHPDFIKIFGEISKDDMLKRPPKDFPADFPDIELLMYKSYTAMHFFSDTEVKSENFTDKLVEVCKALYPLNKFLNRALEA